MTTGFVVLPIYVQESGWVEAYTVRAKGAASNTSLDFWLVDGVTTPPDDVPAIEDILVEELAMNGPAGWSKKVITALAVPFKHSLWVVLRGTGGVGGTYIVGLRGMLV